MIHKLNSTLILKGRSGKEYSFSLSTFDSFEDVKDGFTGHGLYLFGNYSEENNYVKFVYMGMASSLNTRFDNHHKEECIKRNGANCIGIHLMNNSTPETRKTAESDILAANKFTCNDQEN